MSLKPGDTKKLEQVEVQSGWESSTGNSVLEKVKDFIWNPGRMITHFGIYFCGLWLGIAYVLSTTLSFVFSPWTISPWRVCIGMLLAVGLMLPQDVRHKMSLLWKAQFRCEPGPQSLDPKYGVGSGLEYEEKTLIFVRHGQSKGNVLIENASYMYRKDKSVLTCWQILLQHFWAELKLLFTSDSQIIDPQLTSKGIKEAKALAEFIAKSQQNPPDWLAGGVAFACSYLRRAAATALISVCSLLEADPAGPPVVVVPDLAEVSWCPDTIPLAKPRCPPSPKWDDAKAEVALCRRLFAEHYKQPVPAKEAGRPQFEKYLPQFFSWTEPTVMLFSHSTHIQVFFQTFLPRPAGVKQGPGFANTFPKPDPNAGLGFRLQYERMPTGSAVLMKVRREKRAEGEHFYVEPSSVQMIFDPSGKYPCSLDLDACAPSSQPSKQER